MRSIRNCVILGLLFSTVLWTQEDKTVLNPQQVSEEEWNNIVDYLNAEVAMLALKNQEGESKKLEENEKPGFNALSDLQKKNSITSPLTFSALKAVLNPGWDKTFENIIKPIDSLKGSIPKTLDSLFLRVDDILKMRTPKIVQNDEYSNLKEEIEQSLKPEETKVSDSNSEADLSATGAPQQEEYGGDRSYLIIWMISTILLFVSVVVLIFKLLTFKRKNKALESSISIEHKNSNKKIETLKNQLSESRQNEVKNSPLAEYGKENGPSDIVHKEDAKSPVVEFSVVETTPEPIILYAGKPSHDNKFTKVSNTPIDNQTIFKLTLHPGGMQADFEVDLVDNYITRSVTNAPDEHLYRVCNQENSNKDFSREIITIKKGLAKKIEGHWTVKEEDKATIKFQ